MNNNNDFVGGLVAVVCKTKFNNAMRHYPTSENVNWSALFRQGQHPGIKYLQIM